jgi:Co/Zn/Cd efflux system component
MQVLALTLALFGTVTSAQTIGAIIAHSEAMLADSCAMWVDCMTYMLNIFAEASAGKWFHKHCQVAIPAISMTTLIYATTTVLHEAIRTINSGNGSDDDDDVNPHIVLGFSLWCMCFDFTALSAFVRNQREKKSSGGVPINMLVACAHVAADFCRSVTTLTESMLIMVFKFDGTSTDAWSCVIVSCIILLGTAFPIWEWVKAISKLCSSSK